MLKIGKINYLNVYPIFEGLKKYCQFCEFVEGEPSKLNEMIYNGEIDVCPSSSVEYLKNREKYFLFDEFSISSRKKILSVILVLNNHIEEISNDTEIYLTPSSATSNSLVKIIFFEFYGKKPKFIMNSENIFNKKNQVLIGDNALNFYFRNSENFYIYDLAELWYNFTKLPFVFALWIVNRSFYEKNNELIEIFRKILKKSIRSYVIPKNYKDFKQEEIIEYFQYVDYNFSSIHRESLELFERLGKKWKIF